MPRIIKSQDLIVKDPVIIDPVIKDPTPAGFTPLGATIVKTNKDMLNQQNNEFDSLMMREEADKILQETEQMVMDILEKARSEANNIIAEALEESEDLKKQAMAESESIKKAALEKGYQEGWESAQHQLADEKMQAINENQNLIEEAWLEKANIIKSSQEMIFKLAASIARKIIDKEIQQDPEIIVGLVRDVVELLGDSENIKVLVSPIDYESLINMQHKITSPGQGIGGIELVSDERISPGGCMAESELGSIDGRVETRINNLENSLIEAAGGE